MKMPPMSTDWLLYFIPKQRIHKQAFVGIMSMKPKGNFNCFETKCEFFKEVRSDISNTRYKV